MIMRRKPVRGEKYMVEGEEVTVLEIQNGGKGNMVSVVLPGGKLGSVHKKQLGCPTIDTKDYEKI